VTSPRVPRVLAVTGPDAPLDHRFESWLADLAVAGVDAVQVRRKELSDRELLSLVERARIALAGTPVTLLVNGRADVTLAAEIGGIGGVHLPAAGLPTRELRALLARRGLASALIGRSVHGAEEIAREAALGPEGPDYLLFGPVHPTPGKEAAGLDALRAACASGVPVLAVGGIEPDRVAGVAAAGAAGVAAIRACRDRAAAAALVAAVREAFGGPAAGPRAGPGGGPGA
jgi:thiamine-phosphate pyrophosphorylase